MNKKIQKQFQLNSEKIETLEDVKKIFNAMHVRIYEDNPFYDEIKHYFDIEVIPKGYLKLLEIMSEEEIKLLSREEVILKCNFLSNDTDVDNEIN